MVSATRRTMVKVDVVTGSDLLMAEFEFGYSTFGTRGSVLRDHVMCFILI